MATHCQCEFFIRCLGPTTAITSATSKINIAGSTYYAPVCYRTIPCPPFIYVGYFEFEFTYQYIKERSIYHCQRGFRKLFTYLWTSLISHWVIVCFILINVRIVADTLRNRISHRENIFAVERPPHGHGLPCLQFGKCGKQPPQFCDWLLHSASDR